MEATSQWVTVPLGMALYFAYAWIAAWIFRAIGRWLMHVFDMQKPVKDWLALTPEQANEIADKVAAEFTARRQAQGQ